MINNLTLRTYEIGGCVMAHSEISVVGSLGSGIKSAFNRLESTGRTHEERVNWNALEHFMATALGSRGGPNKVSNKLRRRPNSYA